MSTLQLPFTPFLALRYLKPKRTFLSIITLISIIGVTLGVTVLILVISVMTGFELELRRKVIGFDPHVIVTSNGVLENWRDLMKQAASQKFVIGVAPYVQGPVILEFNHQRLAPYLRGIDPDLELKVTDIRKLLFAGKFDLNGDNAILGIELARILGINVGDKITVYSPGNLSGILSELDRLERHGTKEADLSNLRQLTLPKTLTVTGIFQTGRYLYDSQFFLVPLYIGQELYDLEDSIHGLAIKTSDPYGAPEVKRELLRILPPELSADTWIDRNKSLFDAIHMERNVMFFLLMFIILVAAFGIMNTLITVTVQKTREIGVLKALGAQIWQIIGVFVAQGMVVGLFGTLSGLGLGMWLVHYRNEVSHWLASIFGIQIFPKDVYQFSEIPAEVIPSDVFTICITAFIICSLAALIPAWFAARLDPVKALRRE
ncbi:MAG: ABC transporter permease [Verrucomicrobia bacterium]|nr:MAG: ABC transporter permease [Verrucomicrobiota bacterium]